MEERAPPPPVRRIPPPPPQRAFIHTFSDGSLLRKMPARDLCKIPIWHGNRIMNEEHKKEIAQALGPRGAAALDLKPFHVVTYPCYDEDESEEIKTFIVDGQHRVSILKEHLQANSESLGFDVLVVEKSCASETEVIQYFKLLNTTRAIEWKEDPRIAANRFVAAFEAAFNKGRKQKDLLVRGANTHRPYLSVDRLRDELIRQRVAANGKAPEEFVEFCIRKNTELVELISEFDIKEKIQERAIVLGFCLALDEKFGWLADF